MDKMTQQDIENRKKTIGDELETLFTSQMAITDWDVPEAEDQEAAEMIIAILENRLSEIKENVKKGVYKDY